LNAQTVAQYNKTPSPDQLHMLASRIKHPLLKPVVFNLSDGLSPDEAAILAVLQNKDLRLARDKAGIADAQLLQAGLLPNPRIAYNFANTTGGLDNGKVMGYGLSLDWEITALLTQAHKKAGAKADQQSINLQIAWQEWQVAQAAKLACYQWQVYAQQQSLLEDSLKRLSTNNEQLRIAADKGLITALESLSGITAQTTLENRLESVLVQKNLHQQRLNRVLGRQADESIPFQESTALPEKLVVPSYAQLTSNLAQQRLDLLALKQSYENQEQQVHIAVLQQFPKISIGITHTKNNSDYYTMGAGISLSLPVFDQNQGAIALAKANRQIVIDEYSNRDFQSKADIAELLVTVNSINGEIKTSKTALSSLENVLKAYDIASQQGQIDRLMYYTAWSNVFDKKVDLLTLQLHLVEAQIALETATGRYTL
jgi:outer membrane protein TolC